MSKKQFIERDTTLHNSLLDLNKLQETKALLFTVKHDVQKPGEEAHPKTLEAYKRSLLSKFDCKPPDHVDMDPISTLPSEFIDVLSFCRSWHPISKASIDYPIFHIPPNHNDQHCVQFWQTEPDALSSLDLCLLFQATSPFSDHGAKLIDLLIGLLKMIYKRRQIDITNWSQVLLQWLQQIILNQFPSTNDAPSINPPASLPEFQTYLLGFMEFQKYNTMGQLPHFHVLRLPIYMRCYLFSILCHNAFLAQYESLKTTSDKYDPDDMRMDPVWSPILSTKGVCGELFYFNDDCLWYYHTEWYLIAYTQEHWDIAFSHPTIDTAIQQVMPSITSSTAGFTMEPFFYTKRQHDMALFQIDDQLQSFNENLKRQFIEQQRVHQHQALVNQSMQQLQHLTQYSFAHQPTQYIKSKGDVVHDKEFIPLDAIQFKEALPSPFYLYSHGQQCQVCMYPNGEGNDHM